MALNSHFTAHFKTCVCLCESAHCSCQADEAMDDLHERIKCYPPVDTTDIFSLLPFGHEEILYSGSLSTAKRTQKTEETLL